MMTTVETTQKPRRFYQMMAWVFVAVAFGGFIPTYWLKLMDGSFAGKPILHIHGFLLFAWVLFYAVQVNFVANRKMADHRSWGIAGVSLFTALAISIVLAAINTIKQGELTGFATQAASFSIVTFSGIAIITAFITLAIMNVHRPEWHSRLMSLSFVPLLEAPMARPFAVLMTPPGAVGPPPVFVTLPPSLVIDLLLIAFLIYDRRVLGRFHPVTVWGAVAIIAVQILCVPISTHPAWIATAKAIAGLAS
jgi:hypothetical protein